MTQMWEPSIQGTWVEGACVYLEHITQPADVRALPASALPALCAEIRAAILASSAAHGGHVGSNLGDVELTVALHRVFDSPADKLVFDVSHQTYAHKMLTGRAKAFLDPACHAQVSGFSNPAESEHDLFAMGHTSTSVSLACGLAHERDLAGGSYDVVAVIGDGSLSGGLALEGLDNAAELAGGLIVVVNDNGLSIAPNSGGLYRNLDELRRTHGKAPCNLFRALGLEYRYLDDGNDVAAVEGALLELKGTTRPTVLHVRTTKGLGYAPALRDAEGWHHVGPFNLATGTPAGRPERPWAELTGSMLLERMGTDPRLVVVSAATPYVMGFGPERRAAAGRQFVDVGIAEGHAVTFCTGLARAGARPVLGIYGTFLQRAYDELWHDVCLNRADVAILVFGSSAYGTPDATHLGFFDIAMLGDMPGLSYLAPAGEAEYRSMLGWALEGGHGPVAIRVPVTDAGEAARNCAPAPGTDWSRPRWQTLRRGSRVAVVSLGDALGIAAGACDELEARGLRPTLVNARFATQLDPEALGEVSRRHDVVVTVEDGVAVGGWGQRVAAALGPTSCRALVRGLPLAFPNRYDAGELLASRRMTPASIATDALKALGEG